MKRLGVPRKTQVVCDEHGLPRVVGRQAVETVREDWVVEDRWWTGKPLRRRYFELVLGDGRCVVVFRDLVRGRWFSQRG